jgi:hypothetical protein
MEEALNLLEENHQLEAEGSSTSFPGRIELTFERNMSTSQVFQV